MDILFLIGRILYGGILLFMGLNHFIKIGDMTSYAQSKGVPSPKLAVIVTGFLIVLGSLGVLLGAYVNVALWLLVIFFVVVTIKMHNFWAIDDPQAKMVEMVNFMKNMALLGAALMMMLLELPWAYALNL